MEYQLHQAFCKGLFEACPALKYDELCSIEKWPLSRVLRGRKRTGYRVAYMLRSYPRTHFACWNGTLGLR
jgi:hypothetical protein